MSSACGRVGRSVTLKPRCWSISTQHGSTPSVQRILRPKLRTVKRQAPRLPLLNELVVSANCRNIFYCNRQMYLFDCSSYYKKYWIYTISSNESMQKVPMMMKLRQKVRERCMQWTQMDSILFSVLTIITSYYYYKLIIKINIHFICQLLSDNNCPQVTNLG